MSKQPGWIGDRSGARALKNVQHCAGFGYCKKEKVVVFQNGIGDNSNRLSGW